jgi:hypothetical protein
MGSVMSNTKPLHLVVAALVLLVWFAAASAGYRMGKDLAQKQSRKEALHDPRSGGNSNGL